MDHESRQNEKEAKNTSVPNGVPRDPVPDEDEELRLAPDDGLSALNKALHERHLADIERGSTFQPVEFAEKPVRFSVGELLVLTAFAAVLFACLQLLPPNVFAGILGVIAFVSLMVLSITKPQKSILHVGWWVLLIVYLVSALAAAFRA